MKQNVASFVSFRAASVAYLVALLALTATFAAAYLILRSSEYVSRILGVTGILVMTRIMGLMLGAIAVNFVAIGAWNIYAGLSGIS